MSNKFIDWQKMPPVFEALGQDNFRYFFFGQLVSLTGLWMMMMATSWLIYDMTGSRFLLGMVNTVSGLPALILNPVGGIFADRMDKKMLLLFTQVASSAISFLIGFLISVHMIGVENLTILVFVFGLVSAIDSPTRQAFVIELVEKRTMGNAIALNSLGFNSARIIGPAVAGYLIGMIGVESCYFINAVSFIAVIISLLMIKGDFGPKNMDGHSIRKDFMDGLEYLFRNKRVLASLVVVAFTSIFIMPYAILMPVFVKDIFHRGPEGMGILMAFSGLGALIGALGLAQFSRTIDYKKFILFSSFIMTLASFVFSYSTSFSLAGLMLIFMGWGIVSQAASVNTVIQQEVPNKLRGRIMGFYAMSFMGFMPVGAFQAGIVSHFYGAQFTLAAGAVLSLLPTLLLLLRFAGKEDRF
jgi:MFS family permease